MDLIPIARDIVMDKIPDMVFVVDSYDRVLDANAEAEKWLGLSQQDIVGRDPMDVFRKWPQLINRILATEETREEIEIPGDTTRTLEVIVTPIYDELDVLKGRVVMAYDITHRKNMENELKRTNEALRARINEVEVLRAQLQEQAIRDPLTGAFNRRFLAESLDKEISKAERKGMPVSIVMMDVDHFKKFNDTYGHKYGDAVLQDLAMFIINDSRLGDIVCRYGGEEFVILMPNAEAADAYERAERWRHEYSAKTLDCDGKKLRVTFSAGVASYPLHGENGEFILHGADEALYLSKNNGRNKVTLYEK